MSKETELSAILSHAAQAGLLPNTIHSWLPALTRYTESIIAADRELRQGDAGMPVICHALEWTFDGEERGMRLYDDERHCLFDSQSDGGVCSPLVRQSDAQAALAAKDAKILALEAQITVLKNSVQR